MRAACTGKRSGIRARVSASCACASNFCGFGGCSGFEFLVNHARWFRRFWEYYLSFVIRGKVMEFTFEVEK